MVSTIGSILLVAVGGPTGREVSFSNASGWYTCEDWESFRASAVTIFWCSVDTWSLCRGSCKPGNNSYGLLSGQYN